MQVSAAPTTTSASLKARSNHKLEARSSKSGDATYYSVGLGSCGHTNSDSEMVAALSSKLMGSGSKGSYCGESITVESESGKSVTVKVVDTCPSCGEGDVDLSPSAFKKLGSLDLGVIPITWSL
ncbi:RlpA-like double-psi beta-barrel-protein domain-containing protein-containing protein [Mycotypha africana]|uniref:RlpA-like double-psi beta-barrel-protein domain-containing protein-containing protein n=1 Tax=Mycotypha africana TaxID=64632 RepID=UPI00230107CB|nr:RlpA-like double-psi beta-barrel-protein domain-containing protein-containing protein [Mycotypha africana]KAI8971686.1 RlpA-like double-psi beta-barrel-protein domain-containing protein-containing protein [Mycotypha africana]